MARYIDADKIVFWIKYVSSNGMLCDTDVRKVAFSDEIARMPSADVAPRAEVAREIFAEIKEKGSFSDPCVQHIVLSFDELAEIEKKYTEAEPPKGE